MFDIYLVVIFMSVSRSKKTKQTKKQIKKHQWYDFNQIDLSGINFLDIH